MNEFLSSLPQQILSLTQFDNPQTPLVIYNGSFSLKNESHTIQVEGEIIFKWFPSPGAAFRGNVSATLLGWDSNFELMVEDRNYGSCFITFLGENKNYNILGVFHNQCVTGDKEVPVSLIHFELCNFRTFLGSSVRTSEHDSSANRLSLINEDFEIHIDKHTNFQDQIRALKWDGTYQPLYSGTLKRIKAKQLTRENSEDIFTCLSLFLSFLNGRRSSPIFRKGTFEDQEVWADYSSYYVDKHKDVRTWPPQVFVPEIKDVWINFSKLWKDENSRDCIEVAIHSYIRANGHITFSFEGIATIANTLELLFNYLIVENKKIIAGKDIESLQASNKIRLLLAQVQITNDIPDSLIKLKEYQGQQSQDFRGYDGPELFTQIRNTIVHAQLEKRKRLSSIPEIVLSQVLDLGIWYVELVLLYILDYKGNYVNRTSKIEWVGQGEEIVPWIKP